MAADCPGTPQENNGGRVRRVPDDTWLEYLFWCSVAFLLWTLGLWMVRELVNGL